MIENNEATVINLKATWILVAAFAAALVFTTFQLPYHFPPTRLTHSASYAFGFNNAIAIFLLAALLGMATLYCLVRRAAACEPPISFPERPSDALRPLSLWLFGLMAVVYAAFTLVLYWYMQGAANASLVWEARHFLHRIKLYEIYGMRPYVDFQAEYGPLLMYPPAWLHSALEPMGISREAAYFVCHLLMNLAGLGCLFYILTRIAGPRTARSIAFVLVAIAGFGPYMGLNGVLLRYTAPFIAVLIGHRVRMARGTTDWRPWHWLGTVALIVVLATVNVLTSPEIAVAFVLGWIAYSTLAVKAERNSWRLIPASVTALAIVAFAAHLFLPEAYYGSLLRFSEGANNLPILPAVHILLYLLTLVLIVPPLLATGWRGQTQDAPLIGAFGALCVVMMPGALARCDPPHVMFYGLVASLLLMARLANLSSLGFAGFAVSYTVVFIGFVSLVILNVFFAVRPKEVVAQPGQAIRKLVAHVRSDLTPRDRAYLAGLDRYPQIGIPFATYSGDHAAEDYLFTRRQLAPEFYVAIVGVYTAAEIHRKLRDTAGHEYLLVAGDLQTGSGRKPPRYDQCASYKRRLNRWFLFPTDHLVCKRPDLNPNAVVSRFILDHYEPVEQVGRHLILRRVSDTVR